MTTAPPAEQPGDAPPAASAGHERRLHPWSWLFVLLQQLRQFLVPLLVLVVVGSRGGDRYMLWSLVGVGVLVAASVWRYFTYRYRVDADRVVVREGLLERKVRQIPFARIHNVTLHQTLLHRLVGVAEVRLESAGGTRPEAEMRVLPMAEALALERLVRARGASPGTRDGSGGNGDAATEAGDGRLLLALPLGELVRLGLVSNRGMVGVGGAFALAWQAFPDDVLAGFVREHARQAMGWAGAVVHGSLARAVALAATVALALVVLRLLSVLLALTQYHGFRLSLQGRRLTVERGLLSRLRTSTSRRRIQAWTLREGLVHRLLGRRSLHVDTAGGVAGGDGDAPAGLRELAPIATPDACDALVREVLPGAAWPPAGWRRLHPHAWWRLALPGAGLALVATGLACWRFGPPGLLALAWLPWAVFAARRHAGHAGYALGGRLLAVRAGWWSRHWRFAEIDKIQALRLERSPLDRLSATATLLLDTAGATPTSPALRLRFLPEAEARALHARLAAELACMPLRW